jgi:DNA invertase Pin-like site-specific DNA recombinase
MNQIYGYCRISTYKQNIERQERNIKTLYPEAVIIKEVFTGTQENRPEWRKLYGHVDRGDMIIFDSVSRMSRNAEEGFRIYRELYNRGVELVFLKERHIDTSSFKEAMTDVVSVDINAGDAATNDLVRGIMDAVNRFMLNKCEADIQKAFEQSEKEVLDLRQRTKEGIITEKLKGSRIGTQKGDSFIVKKRDPIIKIIRERSRDFGGPLNDRELLAVLSHTEIAVPKDSKGNTMKVSAKISRNTFYRYKALARGVEI